MPFYSWGRMGLGMLWDALLNRFLIFGSELRNELVVRFARRTKSGSDPL
jgi:hypothetical protein